MKKLSLTFLAMLAVISMFSCKKEVSPDLVVNVVDADNRPVAFAWVEVSVGDARQGIVDPSVIDSTKTNEFGRAFFEFENSLIVEVALYMDEFSDIKVDSASIFLETKRTRNKENITESKLVFR